MPQLVALGLGGGEDHGLQPDGVGAAELLGPERRAGTPGPCWIVGRVGLLAGGEQGQGHQAGGARSASPSTSAHEPSARCSCLVRGPPRESPLDFLAGNRGRELEDGLSSRATIRTKVIQNGARRRTNGRTGRPPTVEQSLPSGRGRTSVIKHATVRLQRARRMHSGPTALEKSSHVRKASIRKVRWSGTVPGQTLDVLNGAWPCDNSRKR